jgi:hypothetical protein
MWQHAVPLKLKIDDDEGAHAVRGTIAIIIYPSFRQSDPFVRSNTMQW